ncbi:MAG: hypothetical protein ABIJ56_03060 [Pseudomonadota bacterium]
MPDGRLDARKKKLLHRLPEFTMKCRNNFWADPKTRDADADLTADPDAVSDESADIDSSSEDIPGENPADVDMDSPDPELDAPGLGGSDMENDVEETSP